MAAQWGGAETLLPTWAPDSVRFGGWNVELPSGAADNDRLIVHLVRPSNRLDWIVTDAGEVQRQVANIQCDGLGSTRRIVNGRTVFFRRGSSSEIAWACFDRHPWKLIVSLRQNADSAGWLRMGELERMVASLRSAPAGRAPGSRYELPSRNVVRRMAASFRRMLLLPARLPSGFVFSRWEVSSLPYGCCPDLDSRRTLSVDFGRGGRHSVMHWRVYSGVEKSGFDCPRRPKRFTPTRYEHQQVIDGRTVYASEGIHGVATWTCIGAGAIGNREPLEVRLWYDIFVNSPSMLRFAMRMVATAEVARGT